MVVEVCLWDLKTNTGLNKEIIYSDNVGPSSLHQSLTNLVDVKYFVKVNRLCINSNTRIIKMVEMPMNIEENPSIQVSKYSTILLNMSPFWLSHDHDN